MTVLVSGGAAACAEEVDSGVAEEDPGVMAEEAADSLAHGGVLCSAGGEVCAVEVASCVCRA